MGGEEADDTVTDPAWLAEAASRDMITDPVDRVALTGKGLPEMVGVERPTLAIEEAEHIRVVEQSDIPAFMQLPGVGSFAQQGAACAMGLVPEEWQ